MTFKRGLMNFQRSGRKNRKMASCGLGAVNEPLEEAVSQLNLDSLRDHKSAPYSEFFKDGMHLSHGIWPYDSLWKIDDVSASSS